MPNVSKDDFEALHTKVDEVREDVAEIKGMLKGKSDASKDFWARIGVIGSLVGLAIKFLMDTK